jgi:hypothetical protein
MKRFGWVIGLTVLGFGSGSIARGEDAAPAPPTPEVQAATAKITELGGSVRKVAQNDDSLEVDFHLGGKALTDEGLAQVKILPKVVEVHLKDTQITDAGLAHLAGLKSLIRLHLEQTKITDAGLPHLAGLENLEYLNLYGDNITDAGLEHLKPLAKLKHIYLWQTKVTDDGVNKLKAALPNLVIVK